MSGYIGTNPAERDPVVGNDSVGTSKIIDLAVTTAKIANTNVTNAKIATGIDAVKLADGSVTNTELQYINSLSSNAQTQLNAKGDAFLANDQSWTGSQRGTPSTVTDGTLDLNTANNFQYTPSGSDTLEFSNETAGQSGFIKVINTSGHTISVGSEVKKGASWDVSTAGTYIVSYYCDGTNVYVSASEALS